MNLDELERLAREAVPEKADLHAFMEAFDPQTALKLVTVVRAAQEWADAADSPIENIERAVKARDALREKLAALKGTT